MPIFSYLVNRINMYPISSEEKEVNIIKTHYIATNIA
jgi:hypothetical protein